MSVNMSKVAHLHAEIKALDSAMEKLATERKAKVEALVRANGGESNTGKVSLDGGSFTVSENNTYPDEAIRAALTPGQVKRVEKRVIDKAKVKVLYPEVYKAVKVNNGVKVTIS